MADDFILLKQNKLSPAIQTSLNFYGVCALSETKIRPQINERHKISHCVCLFECFLNILNALYLYGTFLQN